MRTSDLLRWALFLLAEGVFWTKGAYARGADGVPTLNNPGVERVCGVGALRFAAFNSARYNEVHNNERAYIHAIELLDLAVQSEPCFVTSGLFVHWQDLPATEFNEVRLKFLEAIAHAEIEERSSIP